MKQLTQEYTAVGKASTFEALKVFWTQQRQNAALLRRGGEAIQVTTGAVKTHIHRLRKRYTALLREAVSRTMSDPSEIDEEIHALCDALIATEGRLSP